MQSFQFRIFPKFPTRNFSLLLPPEYQPIPVHIFDDCGWGNTEHPVKTYSDTRRTCKLPLGTEPGTFLQWGDRADRYLKWDIMQMWSEWDKTLLWLKVIDYTLDSYPSCLFLIFPRWVPHLFFFSFNASTLIWHRCSFFNIFQGYFCSIPCFFPSPSSLFTPDTDLLLAERQHSFAWLAALPSSHTPTDMHLICH